MKVTITKGTWIGVTATFVWKGSVEYIQGQKRIMFYANELQQNGAIYMAARELSYALPTFFVFDFYVEDGIKKVMFFPKDFTEIKFE